MRWITALAILVFSACAADGQTDIQKLVAAEHAFAQMAAENGTKAAFLANMTDDALVLIRM